MERSLLTTQPIPVEMWVLYELHMDAHNVNSQIYIEAAKINRKQEPGVFAPLGPQRLKNLITSMAKDPQDDVNICTLNYGKVMYLKQHSNKELEVCWITFPMLKEFSFHESLKIPDGSRPVPGLVWYKNLQNSLYIWAYKEWRGPNTVLYNAPIHNVYKDARMCITLNDISWIKGDTVETYTARIQTQLFNTKKSEIHNAKGCEENLNTLYRRLKDKEEFPNKVLTAWGRDLQDTLKMYIRKTGNYED